MTRFRTAVAALLVCAAASLTYAASAQTLTLKLGWTKGETFQYRATQQVNVAMSNLPGMGDMTVTTNAVQLQTYSVDDVASDGTARLKVTFDAVKMDMVTPMGTMAYDSATPPKAAGDPMSDMMAKSMGALVGQSVVLVVAPDGEMKDIEGLAELAAKMNAGAAGASGGLPGMGSIMSEDSLRGMFEQSFAGLPNRPISIGDTWSRTTKTKMAMGTVETAMTFTLKGVQTSAGQQLAALTVAAKNTVTMDPAATANLPMKMTMGAGESQGDLLLDTKTGRLHRSTIHTTQPMTMNMTGPDGSQVSMNAMTKTTVTVELVKK